jgi:hypothetical protein
VKLFVELAVIGYQAGAEKPSNRIDSTRRVITTNNAQSQLAIAGFYPFLAFSKRGDQCFVISIIAMTGRDLSPFQATSR